MMFWRKAELDRCFDQDAQSETFTTVRESFDGSV